jgi:hypothetical protein|tara:strand:+ start:274 stop:723 length:450 start_codon:yes stop_codon:yes gene_type:complete
MIDGIPQVLTGEAYYPHVKVPVPNYQQTANGYEINLAVSDEVFQQFKDAGFNVGLKEAGRAKYTEDPVVHFYQWEINGKGEKNAVPKLVDADKNEIDVQIGNGSKVAIQWRAAVYGPNKQYKRAILEAVQVLELQEYGSSMGSETELAF